MNGEWLRIACELIEDDRREARVSMLDAYPNLRGMYNEDEILTNLKNAYYLKTSNDDMSGDGGDESADS